MYNIQKQIEWDKKKGTQSLRTQFGANSWIIGRLGCKLTGNILKTCSL